MNLMGNNCERCENKYSCENLLGYRTVWCRVESVLQNLTSINFEGIIDMKCEKYTNYEEGVIPNNESYFE